MSFFIHSGVAEDRRRQSGLSAGGDQRVSSLRSTEEEMSKPLFINSAKEIVFFIQVCWLVSNLTQKQQKRFPWNEDGGQGLSPEKTLLKFCADTRFFSPLISNKSMDLDETNISRNWESVAFEYNLTRRRI